MKNYIKILPVLCSCLTVSAQEVSFSNPTIMIESDPTQVDVVGYISSNNGAYKMTEQLVEFVASAATNTNGTITLNPDKKKQKIDGFGFAITGSASYNLMKMKEEERKSLLTQIFSPTVGYGCSYVRIPIGCSDFSLSEYTCCDTPGIENFALTDEENLYIIPVMQEILKINPNVKVISAPWTPPRWMTTEPNKWTGGFLIDTYYDDYSQYFINWITAFKNKGINIYGVTPQNEPLNDGNSASLYMGWEQQRNFIRESLGPKLKASGLDTRLYVYDHNYNYDNKQGENHFPVKIYNDKEANQYITGSAYHNYGGNASEMTYVHNQYPDKELIFTEWTAGTWSWPGVGMEAITTDAKALIYDVVNNWGQGAVVWNLLLDSDRGPYRPGGCDTGNGAVDISKTDYSTLTFNSFYYVICTAASAVSETACLIESTGGAANIECVAFDNGDGYGVVLMNTSDADKNICIKQGSNQFKAFVPANSIASYRW